VNTPAEVELAMHRAGAKAKRSAKARIKGLHRRPARFSGTNMRSGSQSQLSWPSEVGLSGAQLQGWIAEVKPRSRFAGGSSRAKPENAVHDGDVARRAAKVQRGDARPRPERLAQAHAMRGGSSRE